MVTLGPVAGCDQSWIVVPWNRRASSRWSPVRSAVTHWYVGPVAGSRTPPTRGGTAGDAWARLVASPTTSRSTAAAFAPGV